MKPKLEKLLEELRAKSVRLRAQSGECDDYLSPQAYALRDRARGVEFTISKLETLLKDES